MELFNFEHFYKWDNPELWVGIGLLIFFAILVGSGALKMVGKALDAKGAKIQSDLDEAQRLREEAEAMLAQIRKEKAEAEAQAADMLKAAEEDARRLEEEAKAKLEETLTRRKALAERRIAQAEAQATAEVKAAAAELAAQHAETILAARAAASGADPLIDKAIAEIGRRL